jgi:hypothetical protein
MPKDNEIMLVKPFCPPLKGENPIQPIKNEYETDENYKHGPEIENIQGIQPADFAHTV